MSMLTLISANSLFLVNFEKTGYAPDPNESVVLRPGNGMEKDIPWGYHDVNAGMSSTSITADELRQIYGLQGRVNIYTGQITNVSPGKEAFEHNINTFRGCSGAVIFFT
jgi:hypothetical protein